MKPGDQPAYRPELSSEPQDARWDDFLALLPDNNHLQSSLWSRLKARAGWQVVRLVVTRGGRVVGGFQLLHKKLPLWGRVGYVPRGPVVAEPDAELRQLICARLDSVARTSGLAYVAVQPPRSSAECAAELRALGYRPSAFRVAPSATVLIDLDTPPTELLARMSKSRRRAVHRATASSTTVRLGTKRDLPVFSSLLAVTAKRHGFSPPSAEYFRAMWTLFSVSNRIVLFIAEHAGEPVAAELDIAFGDTLVAKRAGWSRQHAKLHPNELVVWAALNWARQQGLKHYDFEGIDRDHALALEKGNAKARCWRNDPAHDFKLGFGGRIVLLPEACEHVYSRRLGWLHRNLWCRAARMRLVRKLANKAIARLG